MRYELKPRSTGELLDAAFALYRNHFMDLFQIVLVVAVPLALARLAVVHTLAGVWALEYVPRPGSAGLPMGEVGKMLSIMGITLPLIMLAYSMQGAVLASAVSDLYLGKPLNPWARMVSAMPSILMASFLSSLGIALGSLLFLVPGVILGLRWSLAHMVIVVEGVGGSAGLARSRDLVKGRAGKVGIVLLVVAVITAVISGSIAVLLPASLKAIPLVPQLLQLAVSTLIMPWGQAVMVLLYFDARIEKEAFDLETLAADMSKPVGASPVAAPQG